MVCLLFLRMFLSLVLDESPSPGWDLTATLPDGLAQRIDALNSMATTGVVLLSMLAAVPRVVTRILLLKLPLQKILPRLGLEVNLSRMYLMSPPGDLFQPLSLGGGTFLMFECRLFAVLSAWSLFPVAERLLWSDLEKFLH